MFFLILLKNTGTKKRKTTCLLLIIKMQIPFPRAIITSTARASSVSIAGFQCHAKWKLFSRQSPESGKRKMVNMQRLSPQFTALIFLKRHMQRNFLPNFIGICTETPCWCPSRWAPSWRPEPTETSVTAFCYKSVNLSLEELENIKMILFLIHELFR